MSVDLALIFDILLLLLVLLLFFCFVFGLLAFLLAGDNDLDFETDLEILRDEFDLESDEYALLLLLLLLLLVFLFVVF